MCVASVRSTTAARILAGIILLGTVLVRDDKANATSMNSHFNIQAQTTCEAEILTEMGAREVASGRAYNVLTEIAHAYGRAVPHIYIFPRSANMAYIAGSAAVDGRGKIVVGQRSIRLFDSIAFKGFLGHEMAHLVSDNGAKRCSDYIVRNPQMEADADALAARMVGKGPVEAFLRRVLALTGGQSWDAKRRLEILQSFQSVEDNGAIADHLDGTLNPD